MTIETNTVSQLTTAQIEAINAFLAEHNQQIFSDEQITFLANIETLDVLGMATHCNLVRGYFGSFSHIHPMPLYGDAEGVSYDDLMDEFLERIDKTEYEQDEYEALKKAERETYKAKMAHHGVILSSGTGRSDVLFLNKDFHPVFIKFIVFNG